MAESKYNSAPRLLQFQRTAFLNNNIIWILEPNCLKQTLFYNGQIHVSIVLCQCKLFSHTNEADLNIFMWFYRPAAPEKFETVLLKGEVKSLCLSLQHPPLDVLAPAKLQLDHVLLPQLLVAAPPRHQRRHRRRRGKRSLTI